MPDSNSEKIVQLRKLLYRRAKLQADIAAVNERIKALKASITRPNIGRATQLAKQAKLCDVCGNEYRVKLTRHGRRCETCLDANTQPPSIAVDPGTVDI